jgi:beta-fructofuranosidase
LIGTEGFRHNNAEGQAPMWTAGAFKPDLKSKSVSLERKVSGPLDHGQYYYAPGLLQDTPNNNRMLVSGWIKEDPTIAARQKWSGVLSVTRQLEMTKIDNVVLRDVEAQSPSLSSLPDRGFLVHERNTQSPPVQGAKIVTLETLGIKPIPELTSGSLGKQIATLSSKPLEGNSRFMTSAKSTSFHVKSKFTIDPKSNPVVGLTLRSTPDASQETLVLYDHAAKLLKVHRPPLPGSPTGAIPFVEQGEFELFELLGKDGKSIDMEELELSVFVDNSVVEVFANGRFALSTRIYPSALDANGIGAVGRQGSAKLVDLTVQDFQK